MYILGINAYHADGSAVLLRDGELVVALEEERFRRIKHWAGFPSETIRKCLEIGGIRGAEVSHVAVSRDPSRLASASAMVSSTGEKKPFCFVARTKICSPFRVRTSPI